MSERSDEQPTNHVDNEEEIPVSPAATDAVSSTSLPSGPTDRDAEAAIRRLSRRSFLWAGAVTVGAVSGLIAFNKNAPTDGTGIKKIFRDGHEFNEAVARRLFYSPTHMAREFPRSAAVEPRNNYHGATPEIDLEAWRLTLEGGTAGTPNATKTLTLAEIQSLPIVSQTTELKCVEGWSAIVNWSGVRFVDFAAKYPPPPGTRYVAMRSEPEGYEDEWYYVGLDIESCLHPQTLLATAMNDKPLNAAHGAPLRLVMPHKYGIKNIKLITTIAYSAERPKDYWEKFGYDWYAGL
jgi:DMSO/TMAO reductase YedYZ molybdopterin-dependent catalytic subunit